MLSIAEIRTNLELIIDRHSLSEVIKAIAFINQSKPNPGLNQQDFEELSEIVGELDWVDLKEELSNICHEKAEHISSNWQDEVTAQSWLEDDKTIRKIKNLEKIVEGDKLIILIVN